MCSSFCDKLVRVMIWLKHEAHLDDKLDILEKIDELFEEKEGLVLQELLTKL